MVRTDADARRKRKIRNRSILLGVVVYVGMFLFIHHVLNPPLQHVGKTVMLHSGETVWQLAAEFYPHNDTNQAVYAILNANKISDAGDLQPGQVIYLP